MVSGAARDDTYGADTDNAAPAPTLRIVLRFMLATTSSRFFYTRKPK